MTARLVALDWHDALVIAALLLAVIASERVYERTLFARERRLTRAAIRGHAHGEPARQVDHEACSSCGTLICFCPSPGECEGCLNLGCLHLTTAEFLCADCRSGCAECRAEDEVERAIACLRDDAAERSFR